MNKGRRYDEVLFLNMNDLVSSPPSTSLPLTLTMHDARVHRPQTHPGKHTRNLATHASAGHSSHISSRQFPPLLQVS